MRFEDHPEPDSDHFESSNEWSPGHAFAYEPGGLEPGQKWVVVTIDEAPPGEADTMYCVKEQP